MARRKNERGKLGNMVERGEHQLQEVAYSRFEPLDGENGGRTREFHGEVKLGQNWNWRPGDPRFPARRGSELGFEGPWRELGRWRTPGCSGFEFCRVELADFGIERVVRLLCS